MRVIPLLAASTASAALLSASASFAGVTYLDTYPTTSTSRASVWHGAIEDGSAAAALGEAAAGIPSTPDWEAQVKLGLRNLGHQHAVALREWFGGLGEPAATPTKPATREAQNDTKDPRGGDGGRLGGADAGGSRAGGGPSGGRGGSGETHGDVSTSRGGGDFKSDGGFDGPPDTIGPSR